MESHWQGERICASCVRVSTSMLCKDKWLVSNEIVIINGHHILAIIESTPRIVVDDGCDGGGGRRARSDTLVITESERKDWIQTPITPTSFYAP